ncbi:hypothetical protein CCH79_00005460 [Gambusia affinis]|uniref:Uncharacterized protein n=1 Tax=Gambusia affinis TaxID=33528 RepID=A0A315VP51_GAMAF|nr:hypothetical protein CCH79_00005460 [Gambusia affinis]
MGFLWIGQISILTIRTAIGHIACIITEAYTARASPRHKQLHTIPDINTPNPSPSLSPHSPLSVAHGIRADGDAKEADVGAAGVGSGGNCTGPAGPAEPGQPTGLQRMLLLLVLLL